MRSWKATLGLLVLGLTLATSAIAVTLAELTTRTTELDATFSSLRDRADACPGGVCTERTAIENDFTTAEADRATLKADRETLNPCSNCSALDSAIATVDARASTMRSILDSWDDQD